MSGFIFEEAKREQARLRLAIMGQSGGGKTWSLLDIMYGVVGDWSRIFVIDTERGSASLYAHKCGNSPRYKVLRLEPPFSPDRYRQAIKAAEAAGALGIIVDSLSHAWEGEGGALDRVDAAASKTHNSFTAWKDVTPEHRGMVDAILQSPCHIGVTLRSKQEYVLDKDERTGKVVPKRVGLAPIQRAGMEYEFTVFMDIDDAHMALASKDRTSLFDGRRFKPSIETGQALKKWLEEGAVPAPPPAQPTFTPAQPQGAPHQGPPAQAAPAPHQGEAAQAAQAKDPFEPNSLVDAVKLTRLLDSRVKDCKTRAEGAKLWDEVNAALPKIGPQAVNDLLAQLKAKAPTLSAE